MLALRHLLRSERALKGFGEPFVPWCLGLSSAPLLLSPSAHSYDAVPFLMHDYDLSRTTNIREVLPSAAFNHTATFNWTFLSTLNAGQWFIKVGLVSAGSVDLCASLPCSGSSAAPGVSTFPASLEEQGSHSLGGCSGSDHAVSLY